jgi:hypothetical protein
MPPHHSSSATTRCVGVPLACRTDAEGWIACFAERPLGQLAVPMWCGGSVGSADLGPLVCHHTLASNACCDIVLHHLR